MTSKHGGLLLNSLIKIYLPLTSQFHESTRSETLTWKLLVYEVYWLAQIGEIFWKMFWRLCSSAYWYIGTLNILDGLVSHMRNKLVKRGILTFFVSRILYNWCTHTYTISYKILMYGICILYCCCNKQVFHVVSINRK